MQAQIDLTDLLTINKQMKLGIKKSAIFHTQKILS